LTASDLIQASLNYIYALSPFALVFAAIACGDQLVTLIKRAVGVYRSRWG
jgi:hypothetical protein